MKKKLLVLMDKERILKEFRLVDTNKLEQLNKRGLRVARSAAEGNMKTELYARSNYGD